MLLIKLKNTMLIMGIIDVNQMCILQTGRIMVNEFSPGCSLHKPDSVYNVYNRRSINIEIQQPLKCSKKKRMSKEE
jgi:hypothetical protein